MRMLDLSPVEAAPSMKVPPKRKGNLGVLALIGGFIVPQ